MRQIPRSRRWLEETPGRYSKKKESWWPVALPVALIVVLVSVGLFLVLSNRAPAQSQFVGSLVPPALVTSLYGAAQGPYGQPNSSYTANFAGINANPYYVGARPIVIFIGGDFCGTCAAERWPLIIALMRFGTFTNLRLMTSSLTDQYANVTSFSFYGSSYSSAYVVFESYEAWNRNAQSQQTIPSNYTADWRIANQTIPFLTFGDQYLLRGIFSPSSLQGKSWTSIISSINSGTGVGRVIKEVANAMSAVICSLDGGLPTDVCSNPAVSGFILIGRGAPGLVASVPLREALTVSVASPGFASDLPKPRRSLDDPTSARCRAGPSFQSQ